MTDEELMKRLRNAKLEKELNICRMAQVVMKNGIAEAEAYAEELEGDLTELCRQLLAAEDKLAKAVEAADGMLDAFCIHETQQQSVAYDNMCAALAAIKGGA